jgi:hypothetical protein
MLVLALVSPFAALGFLVVMQGFEGWVLGASPDVVPPDAIAVAGMAEDDVEVAAPADPFGRRAQQIGPAKYGNHRRDAA